MSNVCLRTGLGRAENGGVRVRTLLAALTIAILCVCQAGRAQDLDRDSRIAHMTSAKAPPPELRIDINHASVDELMKAPGMTRSWAGRIVRYRPYRTKDDLVERGVVTDQVFERIADYIIAHRDKQ